MEAQISKPTRFALFAMLCAMAMVASAASPYGICSHLTGGSQKEEVRARSFAAMRTAGIGMVRCDFWWTMIERPKGTWDFSNTDAVVAEAKALGITVLPILDYSHGAYPHPQDDQGPWRRYVRAVAERYASDCPVLEVWNEENSSRFWKGGPNPTNYLSVLKSAYEEIKRVSPDTRVAVGGFAGIPFKYIEELYKLGGGNSFDIMTIHPYCVPDAPEGRLAGERGGIQRLRAMMARYGDGEKPIWITEFGYPTNENNPEWTPDMKGYKAKLGVDETRQSIYLARALGIAFAEGVGAFLPYALRMVPQTRYDRERHFALMHPSFAPKPAYGAYATFISMRPAGSTQKTLPYRDSKGVFFPQWRRPEGEDAGMIWTSAGWAKSALGETCTMRLRFTADAVRFFGCDGREIYPHKDDDGLCTLEISGSPVYFVGGELCPLALSTQKQGEK